MAFGKTIELEPISGKNTHEAEVLGAEVIPMGSELKLRIKTLLLGKEISLVVRQVDDSYINIWKLMKSAGLPVSPFLRKNSYLSSPDDKVTHSVAMHDFTHDGSKVYGKDLSWSLKGPEARRYDKNEVDISFSMIVDNQFGDIREEALRLAKKASDEDIVLPEDHEGFELNVSPSGDWRIVMIDIELARQRQEDEPREDINKINTMLAEDFLHFLQSINENISLLEAKV